MTYKNLSTEAKKRANAYRYTSIERYAQSLWTSCKSRARKKNIPFDIEQTDIVIPSHCPILGIPLVIEQGGRKDGTPTVDRLRPELGYIKGNIKVISWRANRLRNDGTLEELTAIVKYLCLCGPSG